MMMNNNLEILVPYICVIVMSFVCEVGSQGKSPAPKQSAKTTEAPQSNSQVEDMLSVLQDAMSGNDISFSALDGAFGDILPAAIAAESMAVPFVDNTRVAWKAPLTNTPPTPQKGISPLETVLSGIAQFGNANSPQGKANLDQLFRASSIVIPLRNLNLKNTQINNTISAVNQSKPNNTNIAQPSETRQNPVRLTRTNTVPIRFPTSNTAIYIPTNLISRIRRQAPRGFLVLTRRENNQTLPNRAQLQVANTNNGSVLVLLRRPTANSNLRNSNTRQVPVQRLSNQPISSRPIRQPVNSAQSRASVNANNRPVNTQRNRANSPRTIPQTRNRSVQNLHRNRRQPVQPRQQQGRIIPRTSVTRRPLDRQSSQISGIVSRNQPIVRAVSRNGISSRSQSLRTGQTGQLPRGRSRVPARRVPARRVPARQQRPVQPPDPFTRRFSAGFLRGSNFLAQPPLENVTFFNADGSRVNIDTDINGNTIRREFMPARSGLRGAVLPGTGLTFGGAPPFGGFGGTLGGGLGGLGGLF